MRDFSHPAMFSQDDVHLYFDQFLRSSKAEE